MEINNQQLEQFVGKIVKNISIEKNYTGYDHVVIVFDDGTSIEIESNRDSDVYVIQ